MHIELKLQHLFVLLATVPQLLETVNDRGMKSKIQENFLCRYYGMYDRLTAFLRCLTANFIILLASFNIHVYSIHFFSRFTKRFEKNSVIYDSENFWLSTCLHNGTLSIAFRINIVENNFSPNYRILGAHKRTSLRKPFFQSFFVKSHVWEVP